MNRYKVFINKRQQPIDGAILVWGRCSDPGRESVIGHHGLKDVLSLECIISDLNNWQNEGYANLICKYEKWCGDLFAGLRGIGRRVED